MSASFSGFGGGEGVCGLFQVFITVLFFPDDWMCKNIHATKLERANLARISLFCCNWMCIQIIFLWMFLYAVSVKSEWPIKSTGTL